MTITLHNRAVNTYTPLRLPLEEEPISPRPNPEWSEAEIRRLLVEQVCGTVRWRESVLRMQSAGVGEYWEIGAGKALSGMIKRIVSGEVVTRAVATPEDVLAAKG